MVEIKPISPNEASNKRISNINPAVIQAVNEILAEKYVKGRNVVIVQDDLLKRIRKIDKKLTSKFLFENKQLDFEDKYEAEGWDVEFDRPAYYESYETTYTFTPKKKKN